MKPMVHAPHTDRAPPTRLPRPTPRFAGMQAAASSRRLGWWNHEAAWSRRPSRCGVSTQVASLRRRQPCSDKAFARGVGLSSASEKREKARRTNHNMHMHMLLQGGTRLNNRRRRKLQPKRWYAGLSLQCGKVVRGGNTSRVSQGPGRLERRICEPCGWLPS